MAERFTERLRQKAAGTWEAQHQHPFVRGIGDGTLGLERFKFWLRQDYVFLIEYARLLALAVARSPDLETMTRFAALLKETVETEMNLHRASAAEFEISREELERELPAPTTRGYNFCCAWRHWHFAELAAALFTCMWAYEIGQLSFPKLDRVTVGCEAHGITRGQQFYRKGQPTWNGVGNQTSGKDIETPIRGQVDASAYHRQLLFENLLTNSEARQVVVRITFRDR